MEIVVRVEKRGRFWELETDKGGVEPEADALADVEAQLEKQKKVNDDLVARMKYLQADLENFRKRADREMQEASEGPVKGLALRLLGVMDELELASKHTESGSGSESVKEGLGMVMSNLESALQWAGVEKIACVGKAFDPRLHEAVEKVEGRALEDTVVEELRAGYTFRGQVLRPSMVKVELATKSAGSIEE